MGVRVGTLRLVMYVLVGRRPLVSKSESLRRRKHLVPLILIFRYGEGEVVLSLPVLKERQILLHSVT